MSYSLFLSIPNIPGESTAAGFTNQIEVFSYSFGVSVPVTIGGGSGSGAGKPSLSDLSFLKNYDRSSPLLLRALLTGRNIASTSGPGVVLSVVPAASGGAAGKPVLTYFLQDVFVSSLQDSGSTGGDSRPSQSLSLAFGVIRETYYPQNPDGSLGSPISVYYNAETNTTS